MYEEAGGDRPEEGGSPAEGGRGLTERGARVLTHVVYGLQAALIINGITLLVGVILNYVKLSDVKGTVHESHFRHQIGTFWVALVAFLAALAVAATMALTGLWGTNDAASAVAVAMAALLGLATLAVLVYLYYRIIRGWLALLEERPVE